MSLIDRSRRPTDKEKARLNTRQLRLQTPELSDHLEGLNEKLLAFQRGGGTLDKAGLRIRPGFSCLATPIDGDSSDRKAPPRRLRPPATRISSSTGSALRLQLMVMALLQLHRKPGARARLGNIGIPIAGDSQTTGWADLVASQPTDSNLGGVFIKARDKRARTVRGALDTLDAAGLVDVPGHPGERNRYEGFALLHESGADARGEREEYTNPKGAGFFSMPPGFVLNGWMHVLDDSEIAVLLMVACGSAAWQDDGLWVFSGETRLRHYGIHRDPFATARKTLEWFGLLEVREVGRHDDGRAEDGDQFVHRIGLQRSGFEQPALPAVLKHIKWQLER